MDEIHKYPRWKKFLKGLFDATKGQPEILVTGSGRLDIYQKGGDSLFGRYHLARLHPFSVGEMLRKDRLSLSSPEEALKAISSDEAIHGANDALDQIDRLTGFPEPLFSGREETLVLWRREHRRLIIREDLRDLTRIRELGLIDALVNLLPDRIASPLSLNALGKDLGVAFLTIQNWINCLERLYFLFEIRPYAGKLARTLKREGKVYLFDGTSIPSEGARFENLMALHLRKACDAWSDWGYGDFNLHYVRDKEKREIDFVITKDQKPYLLVETKLSESDIPRDLYYFQERLKPAHTFQVIRNFPQRYIRRPKENISLCSADRFLCRLP